MAKTISGKVAVFALYKDGEFVDRGTSRELAEKYFLTQNSINRAANSGKTIFGYTVVREADKQTDEVVERRRVIREEYGKGRTPAQIADTLRLSPVTVNKYLREMRKKGEIT